MNKIIAAIDGLKFSDSTTSYAIEMAHQTKAHVLGAFLEDFTYHSYKIQELVGQEGVSQRKLHLLQDEDSTAREKAIETFERLCRTADVNYSLHRDRNIAIREYCMKAYLEISSSLIRKRRSRITKKTSRQDS
jgi:hypothetical protein